MHRLLGVLLAEVLIYSRIQGNRRGPGRCRALRVRAAGRHRPSSKTFGHKVTALPERRQRLVERMPLSTPDNVLVAIPAAVSGTRQKLRKFLHVAGRGSAFPGMLESSSCGRRSARWDGAVEEPGQEGGTSWSVRFIPTQTTPGFMERGIWVDEQQEVPGCSHP